MLIQIIAIIILAVAIWISKDSGYSTPRSFLDLHVYGGWITFVLLCLQVMIYLFTYIFISYYNLDFILHCLLSPYSYSLD